MHLTAPFIVLGFMVWSVFFTKMQLVPFARAADGQLNNDLSRSEYTANLQEVFYVTTIVKPSINFLHETPLYNQAQASNVSLGLVKRNEPNTCLLVHGTLIACFCSKCFYEQFLVIVFLVLLFHVVPCACMCQDIMTNKITLRQKNCCQGIKWPWNSKWCLRQCM